MPRVADHGAQGRGGTFSDRLMHVNRASRKARQLRAAVVSRKEQPMLDVILLAVGLAFFALSIGYAYACDRL